MNEDQLLQPLQVDDWQGREAGHIPLTLREKLLKLFDASDFVRVQNIDSEPFTWQYMPASKEHISFDTTTSTVPMRSVHREPPEVYQLAPGQSAIIVGASAYIMIEGMIKRMITEEAIARDGEPRILSGARARKFAFSDDVKQQEFIDRIYLGKHMPGISIPEKSQVDVIANDLGLTNEPEAAPTPVAPRRPPGRPSGSSRAAAA